MPTTDRIVDITEGPVFLRYENSLLVFERKGKDSVTIPVSDIGVLVFSTPLASFTQPAIAEAARAGICTVFADRNCLPAAMCLPFGVHHQPATRFQRQAEAGAALKKQLWKEIVKSKISHQEAILRELHGKTFGLDFLPARVRSGDTGNVEGRAARIYWRHFLRDGSFRRNREASDGNLLLNYGYTVLRAMTARAICSVGLHPGLGLHHHHRENSFCLADDLMEPFRCYVDWAVWHMLEGGRLRCLELTKEGKAFIVETLLAPIRIEDRTETLFYTIQRLASSLAALFERDGETLRLPPPPFSTWSDRG